MAASDLVDDTLGMWEVGNDADGWTPMICPGWAILNIQALWQGPTVVIANRQQSGGLGRKGYPPLVDESTLSVRFLIVGDVDVNGDPHDNVKAGLKRNYDYLRTHVFDPVNPLRTSKLTDPDGDEAFSPIQFQVFPLPDLTGLSNVQGNLTLTLTEGAHWPEGGS